MSVLRGNGVRIPQESLAWLWVDWIERPDCGTTLGVIWDVYKRTIGPGYLQPIHEQARLVLVYYAELPPEEGDCETN